VWQIAVHAWLPVGVSDATMTVEPGWISVNFRCKVTVVTASEQQSMLNDEATTRDELGRGKLVQTLADVLLDAETPLVVALYGPWGSGKTSMMRQLREALRDRNPDSFGKVRTAWFVPWEHATDSQPAVSLLLALRRDLGLEGNIEVNNALDAIALAVFDEVKIPYLDISMGKVRKNYDALVHQEIEKRSEQARLRERFEEVIAAARGGGAGTKLIVFIDDLDRCQPATAVAVLEALKLYLNLEGCIFVLGIDRQPIEAAIAHEYGGLGIVKETYLDKIVQVPFTIPALDQTWVASYVAMRLPERLKDCQEMLSLAAPDNPRRLKRAINTLFLLERIAKISFPTYDYRILCAIALIQ
jgi:energy-coupling factor transporter ATP-binding protein EcfA2